MTREQLKALRNKEVLNLFDTRNRYFVKIQLNRKEKSIYWERYVSKDRRNWVNWNKYLRLKDVKQVLQAYSNN